jgi:hypothetical protein
MRGRIGMSEPVRRRRQQGAAFVAAFAMASLAFADTPPPALTAAPRPPMAPRPLHPAPSALVQPTAAPLPAAVPATPVRPAPRRRPRPAPPPAAAPPPDLKLALDAPSPDGPWTLHLDNAGTIPVRVVADARLLAIDIVPSSDDEEDDDPRHHKAAHAVRCELPADMLPAELDERAVVLPPGKSYIEKIDPRLFCFGAHDAAALVAGATITPHLVGSRDVAVVQGIDEVEPKIASLHDWAGTPSVVGPAGAAPAPKDDGAGALVVTSPAFEDYGLGWESEVTVTITNRSAQSVAFLLRPETMAFDVTGPSGIGLTDPSPIVHCAWPGPAPAPVHEAYTRLGHNESASITVLLSALCPDDALRHPGLYVVRSKLDTRGASGASVGVRTYVGLELANVTTRLRVRERAGLPGPAGRPQLVDTPAAH